MADSTVDHNKEEVLVEDWEAKLLGEYKEEVKATAKEDLVLELVQLSQELLVMQYLKWDRQ